MSYLPSVRLLLATLVLQLSSVAPLWAQGELSFTRQDFGVGGSEGEIIRPPGEAAPGPTAVTVGDFDGDGQQDLATATSFGTVSILLGNGDGTFEPAQEFVVGVEAVSITVGDFNGDRQQDLATANFCCGVGILLGQGDGTFQSAEGVDVPGGIPQSIAVGDFNGDGRQDLVTANFTEDDPGTVSIFLGQGDGTFQPAQDIVFAFQSPNSVVVGDFNGDRRQDVVVDTVAILLGSGRWNLPARSRYSRRGFCSFSHRGRFQ